MRRFTFAFAFTAVLALTAAGQDAVTIKMAKPKAGDRVRVTNDTTIVTDITLPAPGKPKTQTKKATTLNVYVDEVVEVDPDSGKPTKLIRTYEKHKRTDAADGGPTLPTLPMGKPIVIERKKEKFHFSVVGKELEKKEAFQLDKEFNRSPEGLPVEPLLPEQPVRVGDTWVPDAAKLVAALFAGQELDPKANGKPFECKLVRVVKKEGKPFAVIQVGGELDIRSLRKAAALMIDSGSISLEGTVEVCLDAANPTMEKRVTYKMKMERAAGPAKVTLENTLEEEETRVLLPRPKP